MIHHSIDQRTGIISDSGVHDHAFWFVDNQYILVLKDNLQRDVFRFDFELLRLRDTKFDAISGCGQIFLFGAAFAVYRQIPAFDQLLDKTA